MKNIALSSLAIFFLAVSNAAHSQTNETPSNSSFDELMQKRVSGRVYDPNKPVSKDQMKALAEAARMAPSSYNEQPWFFILTHKNDTSEAYQKAFNSLVEFNQGWAKNAPVLVVIAAGEKSAKNNKPNRWAQYDAGAAAYSMMLKATSMGLMSHQMGGFDADKIKQAFNLPDDITPMAVMAIGYSAENGDPAAKDRKPLKENFFIGSWGKGIE